MWRDGPMIRLANSLKNLHTNNFKDVVKSDIELLDPALLPLNQGLSQGSYVTDDPVKAVIIDCFEEQNVIKVKAGIFYSSIIAGCSCADDPTPVDTIQEYCVLEFDISKETGETSVKLLPES